MTKKSGLGGAILWGLSGLWLVAVAACLLTQKSADELLGLAGVMLWGLLGLGLMALAACLFMAGCLIVKIDNVIDALLALETEDE